MCSEASLFGFSKYCVMLLPMLEKPLSEYKHLKDCWVSDDRSKIEVITDPFWSRDEHSTYRVDRYDVPEKWREDFLAILTDRLKDVSDEYIEHVKSFYPVLESKGVVSRLFDRRNKDLLVRTKFAFRRMKRYKSAA